MKKSAAQLDRDIHSFLQRKSSTKRRSAHSTVSSSDVWDVAMDALLEHAHDPTRAATRAAEVLRAVKASTMSPAFAKALARVPKETRRAFEGATGMVSKKSYDWADFTEGAALGFWASPYMNEVENLLEEDRRYVELTPGPGGNWENVLPEVPPAARTVAKKFTKAVKDQLTDAQLNEIAAKFSPNDAGYKGAMQSQGHGVGWFDEGVKVDPPRNFGETPQIHSAVYRAVARAAREAGIASIR